MDNKPESSNTSTSRAYRVETRATFKPLVIDGWSVIGSEWMGLPTIRTLPPGVAPLTPSDDLTYTYSYYGAVALAASFLAHYPHTMGLECRLVEYERVITHTLKRLTEKELLGEVDRGFALAVQAREQRAKESREGGSSNG